VLDRLITEKRSCSWPRVGRARRLRPWWTRRRPRWRQNGIDVTGCAAACRPTACGRPVPRGPALPDPAAAPA
jgi:hypothetical protein